MTLARRPGRGGGDHRPVGRRQEHVPALPERPGDVPGRDASRSTACGFDAGTPGPARASAILRQVCRRVGMVFQGFNLFPHRTVLENVIEAPIHVLGLARDEAEAPGPAAPRPRRPARPAARDARDSSPAASSSGSRSPGPWRWSRGRSSSTSRPAPSTRG